HAARLRRPSCPDHRSLRAPVPHRPLIAQRLRARPARMPEGRSGAQQLLGSPFRDHEENRSRPSLGRPRPRSDRRGNIVTDIRRVLDPMRPADRALWQRLWTESREQLPFAHRGVTGPLSVQQGRLQALTLTWQESTVLYPLVLLEVGDGRRDVRSHYVYGWQMVHGYTTVKVIGIRLCVI